MPGKDGESVVLPWIIQDIRNGSGILIIDGNRTASWINSMLMPPKVAERRTFDFFSLAEPHLSSTINPLYGESSQEVADVVFSSFGFKNQYFHNVEFKIFCAVTSFYNKRKHPLLARPSPPNRHGGTKSMAGECEDAFSGRLLRVFKDEEPEKRNQRVSGLDAKLSLFTLERIVAPF